MKKLCFLCSLIVAMLTMATPANAYDEATYDRTTDRYLITNASQLMWFFQMVSNDDPNAQIERNAVLTADIVLNENLLQTIDATDFDEDTGIKYHWIMPDNYYGVFDGNNHTISGIYIKGTDGQSVAMVEVNHGSILNLGVLDSYFGSGDGGWACTFALTHAGTIQDCYSYARIEACTGGGLVGVVNNAINNCYFAGEIIITDYGYSSPLCTIDPDQMVYGINNCYYLESVKKEGMGDAGNSFTEEEMKNGQLAVLLQDGRNDSPWGQNISGEVKDACPQLGGTPIYCTSQACGGQPAESSFLATNNPEEVVRAEHALHEISSSPFTCTEDGMNAGYVCLNCSKQFDAEGNEVETLINFAHHTFNDNHVCTACQEQEPVLHNGVNDHIGIAYKDIDYDAQSSAPFNLFYFKATFTGRATVMLTIPAEYTGFYELAPFDANLSQRLNSSMAFLDATTVRMQFLVEKGKEYHIGILTMNYSQTVAADCSVNITYNCSHTTEEGQSTLVEGTTHEATCSEHAYTEYNCQQCGTVVLQYDETSELAAHTNENGDYQCDVCGKLLLAEAPVLVTDGNYEQLGLTQEYVGYKAITNLAQLAGFAEEMGAPLTMSKKPKQETLAAKKRTIATKRKNAQRMATARKTVVPEAGQDDIKYVLTADIVVNDDLFDEDGNPTVIDENGDFRTDLLEWNSPSLYDEAGEASVLFDGNGHTISGLYQGNPRNISFEVDNVLQNYDCTGFLGYVGPNAKLTGLGITKSYFLSYYGDAYSCRSTLAAVLNAGEISNCWSDARMDLYTNSDLDNVGGAVSRMYPESSLTDSYYEGDIHVIYDDGYTPSCRISGLVNAFCAANYCNRTRPVTLSGCHFSGKIYADCEASVSGLVRCISAGIGKSVIDRCYADGEVNVGSKSTVSGLVNSLNLYFESFVISNSYSDMSVNSSSDEYDVCPLVNELYAPLPEYIPETCYLVNCFSNATKYVGLSQYHDVAIYDCYDLQGKLQIDNVFFLDEQSAAHFASGEVAYIMNSEQLSETQGPVWYQELGKDPYPVLKGDEYTEVRFDVETYNYYNLERRFEEYQLNDGDAYTLAKAYAIDNLTYNRTFAQGQDNQCHALYVPFAIPVNALNDGEGQPKANVYRLLNIIENDNDDNGTIDEWVLKFVKLKPGESTKPNTPYIIKPLTDGKLTINLTDAKLSAAEEKSYWCASLDYKFTFTGTYKEKAISQDKEFFISTTGGLQYAAAPCTLSSQRWYMTINDKATGQLVAPSSFNPETNEAKSVRISIDGEGDATLVNAPQLQTNGCNAVFNLQGQRLNAARKGINIINGKKVVLK